MSAYFNIKTIIFLFPMISNVLVYFKNETTNIKANTTDTYSTLLTLNDTQRSSKIISYDMEEKAVVDRQLRPPLKGLPVIS